MLEISDIKLPDATISSNRGKDVSFLRKMDIINLFVMGYELSEHRLFFDVPDGTGGINGASSDEIIELGVPVKRCKRG